MSYREVSEIRDGMRIDWDMPIEMDDGLVLRCDIYRPVKAGNYPVIMTYGPYGKWLHFDDLYHEQWQIGCARPIPTCRPARPTSTSAGRWSIRRSGCRTAMSASASTAAAPGARRA